MTTEAHCSCLPVEANSISLDPEIGDAWGLPALRVTYNPHPDDTKTRSFITERMLELLDAAGAAMTFSRAVAENTAVNFRTGVLTGGSLPS